jgi:hypothetical protein
MHYHHHHHHSTICSHDVTISPPPLSLTHLLRLPPPFDWRLRDLAAVLRVKLQRL